MTATAVAMMVVALLVVPGGLIASTAYLIARPELPAYPAE
ncbi:MAG: MetS family NSS transporter small subunit [Bifidobacteriaceae bacterium]|jgi:hypothetical protein|nr:MetS family NSS transporter small subunit [Bifidobacteriaceae bacterium]